VNVLFVSNGFPPSGQWGTEYYTHQIATALRDEGADVSVLCPRRDGTAPRFQLDESLRFGVRLFEVHNAGDPQKTFADSYRCVEIERIFADLLDRLQPDVVHFTHFLWGLSVRLPRIARSRGIATVATLTDYGLLCHRGQFFDWQLERCGGEQTAATCARCIREPGPYDADPLPNLTKRWAARGLSLAGGLGLVVATDDVELRRSEVTAAVAAVDQWIAPTESMRTAFLKAGVAADRISVLPYAIDEAAYRDALPTTSSTKFRFGFLGQFMPHKGLHVLFEAVRIMQHRLPESVEPWELQLFGNPVGGRHARYLERIWDDELASVVSFFGPFEPLSAPAVMAELDAVVLPSQWDENAPLTLLQARAAGLPIVASDVPGIREVVDTSERQRLVPPGDPRALADALRATLLERNLGRVASNPVVTRAQHVARVQALYVALTSGDLPLQREAAKVAPALDVV